MNVQTRPKPFVFVAMPYAQRFQDVYVLGIKPACEEAGAHAERIDEQHFEQDILDRIYTQIDKADLVVADLTDLNPNVFYEVGYAHALGKRVILLTAGEDALPFDLTHYPHIVYGNRIADMKEELRARVEAALARPDAGPIERSSDLKVYYKGCELVDNPMFTYHGVSDRLVETTLQLDIHHSGLRELDTVRFQYGLSGRRSIVSLGLVEENEHKADIGDGEYICICRGTVELFPGGWKSAIFRFRSKASFAEGQVLQLALRLSSTLGAKVCPFRLKMTDVEGVSL